MIFASYLGDMGEVLLNLSFPSLPMDLKINFSVIIERIN